MSSNLSAEMSRIMSKSVRQGFTFTYIPPSNPGDLPAWAVRSTRKSVPGVEATAGSLTQAYSDWAAACGLSTEAD